MRSPPTSPSKSWPSPSSSTPGQTTSSRAGLPRVRRHLPGRQGSAREVRPRSGDRLRPAHHQDPPRSLDRGWTGAGPGERPGQPRPEDVRIRRRAGAGFTRRAAVPGRHQGPEEGAFRGEGGPEGNTRPRRVLGCLAAVRRPGGLGDDRTAAPDRDEAGRGRRHADDRHRDGGDAWKYGPAEYRTEHVEKDRVRTCPSPWGSS